MYHRQPTVPANTHHQPFLEVSGEGEMILPPNLAKVNLGVMTEGKDVIRTQQQNANEINKVIGSLLSMGISKNQLQTFDYRIDSEYDFDQGKQIFRGYKVTHLLQVKIEELAMVGKIIDTAVKNGANYVANVQYTVKNRESVYLQALSAAIINASQKAQTIAGTLEVHLNPMPISVKEVSGEGPRPLVNQVSYVKGFSSTSTQFEPGEITIKATITAKFLYN
jgi:uncharacterized protein YggE